MSSLKRKEKIVQWTATSKHLLTFFNSFKIFPHLPCNPTQRRNVFWLNDLFSIIKQHLTCMIYATTFLYYPVNNTKLLFLLLLFVAIVELFLFGKAVSRLFHVLKFYKYINDPRTYCVNAKILWNNELKL